MSKQPRRLRRWMIRALITIGILIGLQLSVLAFPYPFFPHSMTGASCTIYSDVDMSAGYSDLPTEIDRRLERVELHTPDKHSRIFVCHSGSLFSFLARLSLLNPHIQGFNLSIFGNSFVSAARVEELSRQRNDWPPYSIVHGGLAHAITHEIAHQYIADEIGFIENYRSGFMKKEGYIEYNVHRAPRAINPSSTLSDRIAILENDNNWYPNDYVRQVYRAMLIVEYLAETKGYSFTDIMHDSVSLNKAYHDMTAWDMGRENPSQRD